MSSMLPGAAKTTVNHLIKATLAALVLLLAGCAGSPAARPTVVLPTAPPIVSTPAAGETSIQWFGQSTFLLTSSAGTKVLMDPVRPLFGYTVPPLSGVSAITVSHEHADNDNIAMATGNPTVLRGILPVEGTETTWSAWALAVKGIRVRGVSGTYHDEKQGQQQGKNTIFTFDVDGMNVVHLGDLAHELTPAQVAAIGPVDVLLVPVGGYTALDPTLDAAKATKVVKHLSPKAVIPMHYRTPKLRTKEQPATADDFLKGKKVERLNSTTYKFSKATLPQVATVFVLNYE